MIETLKRSSIEYEAHNEVRESFEQSIRDKIGQSCNIKNNGEPEHEADKYNAKNVF